MTATPTTFFVRTAINGDITIWSKLPPVPDGYVRTENINRDGEPVWTHHNRHGEYICTYIEMDVMQVLE